MNAREMKAIQNNKSSAEVYVTEILKLMTGQGLQLIANHPKRASFAQFKVNSISSSITVTAVVDNVPSEECRFHSKYEEAGTLFIPYGLTKDDWSLLSDSLEYTFKQLGYRIYVSNRGYRKTNGWITFCIYWNKS